MKQNDSHADRGLRMAVGRKAEMAERMVLPEDFADRLVEHLKGEDPPQDPSRPPREGEEKTSPSMGEFGKAPSLTGGPGMVFIGVAASILLLLIGTIFYKSMKTERQPTLAHQTQVPKAMPRKKSIQTTLKTPPGLPVKGRRTPVRREEAPSLYGRAGEGLEKGIARALPPDTLGNAIWQNEENVMLALEMLEDCAKTIEQSERMVYNDIVETTFRATPQSPRAILVSNELGDYEVIEPPTTVEI
ncbi:MAG: hypothetical protein IJ762_03325 [Bacteroidaceae bacterium]|nr:hypothetical protein [Bacteroidaceae bacterium]